jgi:hypothetical protein
MIDKVKNFKQFVNEITLYHGSKNDFKTFDHSFIKSGQGENQYGYGFYLSTSELVAKNIADIVNGSVLNFKLNDDANIIDLRIRPNLNDGVLPKILKTLEKYKKQLSNLEEPYYDFNGYRDSIGDSYSYGELYYKLEEMFGDKEATKILVNSGIDGGKYIPKLNGDFLDNEFDYVIYNPNVLTKI